MQIDVSITITHTYRVDVADNFDFESDEVTRELLDATENSEEIDNYMGAIEVVNEQGNLLYSDSEN